MFAYRQKGAVNLNDSKLLGKTAVDLPKSSPRRMSKSPLFPGMGTVVTNNWCVRLSR